MSCRAALEGFLGAVAELLDPEEVPTFDDFLEYSENFMLGNTRALDVSWVFLEMSFLKDMNEAMSVLCTHSLLEMPALVSVQGITELRYIANMLRDVLHPAQSSSSGIFSNEYGRDVSDAAASMASPLLASRRVSISSDGMVRAY